MTYLEQFLDLVAKKEPFVEIILVDARGSTPADSGSKALVTKEGVVWGTVGGGKVEAKAINHSIELLRLGEKKNDFLIWNLQRDVGMTCGGEVKLYFDVHFAKVWEIAVFGAGHVSQSLVPLLLTLDCHVTCVDSRLEWIEKLASHHQLKKLHLATPKDYVTELPSDAFFVLMTQGHATDFPILKEILLQKKGSFIGVIGSKSKKLVLERELREAAVPDEYVERFYCPVGLPIGDSSPAEIAVSITSQLLFCRDQGFSKRGEATMSETCAHLFQGKPESSKV